MKKALLQTSLITLLFVAFSNYAPSLLFKRDAPQGHGFQENLTVLTLDIELAPRTELWLDEVNRRYRDAIIIEGHGGTEYVDGEPVWHIYTVTHPDGTPIADVVKQIRRHEPWRRVVILSCNPDGLRLEGIDNVSYSLENVWVIPDRLISVAENTGRDAWYGGGCGDIFEFVQQ